MPATPVVQVTDIKSIYNLESAKLLGKGGYSEVVVARHIASGEERALKVIRKERLSGKNVGMVTQEKEILRRTNHPCIITLHETIETTSHFFLSLDAMSEDLFTFFMRNKCISEELIRKIMYQLISGVAYLHRQSIIHRDIKPENILINTHFSGAAEKTPSRENINDICPDEVDFDVRLADFGLAKLVLEYDVRNTPCGTSFYIAPEILRGIEEQGSRPLCTNSSVVKSIDVWSCGVVFYILFCGEPPFTSKALRSSRERREALNLINKGVLFPSNVIWNQVSNEAKDLICSMLEMDSSMRITAQDALKHSFFTGHGFLEPIEGTSGVPEQPSHHLKAMKMKAKSCVIQSINSVVLIKTPEHQQLYDEINVLQSDQVKIDDADGDVSTYISPLEVKSGIPAKAAVMNPNFKVGPNALKKSDVLKK